MIKNKESFSYDIYYFDIQTFVSETVYSIL